MGLRVLRISALVVATFGLFLLHLYATHRELPLVRIGEVTPMMNFAPVRVEGVLKSDARRIRSGSALYLVDDGTGTIPVFFNRPTGEKLPKAGTRVSVVGNLGVGAGNKVRLSGQSIQWLPGRLEQQIPGQKLSDITPEQNGEPITVYGRVSKVWNPRPDSKAPHRIILSDSSGSLDVVHWFVPELPLAVGDELKIRGTVGVYDGKVQLKVWQAEDIQPLEAEPVKISGITAKMEKQIVSVEGVLGVPRSIPGGVLYPLTDATGTIAVLFWDKQVSGEERDALDEGIRVRITAPVKVYRGTLELVPKDLGAFQVLE
jgi:DNA/RNA endonuclease YhcR with UshA esterase domain